MVKNRGNKLEKGGNKVVSSYWEKDICYNFQIGIFHALIGLLYQELLVFEVKLIFVTLGIT